MIFVLFKFLVKLPNCPRSVCGYTMYFICPLYAKHLYCINAQKLLWNPGLNQKSLNIHLFFLFLEFGSFSISFGGLSLVPFPCKKVYLFFPKSEISLLKLHHYILPKKLLISMWILYLKRHYFMLNSHPNAPANFKKKKKNLKTKAEISKCVCLSMILMVL